jgi:hypothetical protein
MQKSLGFNREYGYHSIFGACEVIERMDGGLLRLYFDDGNILVCKATEVQLDT